MAKKADVYFSKLSKKLKKEIPQIENVILKSMAEEADIFVPHDTGETRLNMKVNLKNNEIKWENPYVEYIYWGINFNFQKTNNSRAQAMWADEATQKNIDEWADAYADGILNQF